MCTWSRPVAGLRVRFRLDGVLQEVSRLARQYQSAVISRIKIMAGLDIAERRLPQDGRARLRLGDREIDLRVSTLPALHGESVVLRILDHGVTARDLVDLGMPDDVAERFDRLHRAAERNHPRHRSHRLAARRPRSTAR